LMQRCVTTRFVHQVLDYRNISSLPSLQSVASAINVLCQKKLNSSVKTQIAVLCTFVGSRVGRTSRRVSNQHLRRTAYFTRLPHPPDQHESNCCSKHTKPSSKEEDSLLLRAVARFRTTCSVNLTEFACDEETCRKFHLHHGRKFMKHSQTKTRKCRFNLFEFCLFELFEKHKWSQILLLCSVFPEEAISISRSFVLLVVHILCTVHDLHQTQTFDQVVSVFLGNCILGKFSLQEALLILTRYPNTLLLRKVLFLLPVNLDACQECMIVKQKQIQKTSGECEPPTRLDEEKCESALENCVTPTAGFPGVSYVCGRNVKSALNFSNFLLLCDLPKLLKSEIETRHRTGYPRRSIGCVHQTQLLQCAIDCMGRSCVNMSGLCLLNLTMLPASANAVNTVYEILFCREILR